jgi:uncharacterized protein (TIGR02217 family)
MSDFIESPRFPACPSFGYTSEPEYKVIIQRRASGVEKRNRAWLRPLIRGTVTVGPRLEAEIEELLTWWHATGGMARGFRFKDRVDWKSTTQMAQSVSNTDQPLVETTTPGVYQLTKRYQVGIDEDGDPVYQDRYIYKPVSGTVVLSGGGSVDYTTGLVTGGGAGTWGGEFDVPMRFDSGFPVEIVQARIESVTFALQELRMTGETG